MNELMSFNNPEFGEIRTTEVDGEPWFVGRDVAREVGCFARAALGDKWAAEHDIPAVRMGPHKRGYETDLVAKAIVQGRGMV